MSMSVTIALQWDECKAMARQLNFGLKIGFKMRSIELYDINKDNSMIGDFHKISDLHAFLRGYIYSVKVIEEDD